MPVIVSVIDIFKPSSGANWRRKRRCLISRGTPCFQMALRHQLRQRDHALCRCRPPFRASFTKCVIIIFLPLARVCPALYRHTRPECSVFPSPRLEPDALCADFPPQDEWVSAERPTCTNATCSVRCLAITSDLIRARMPTNSSKCRTIDANIPNFEHNLTHNETIRLSS